MGKVKVLLSGFFGRTGRKILEQVNEVDGIEVVSGIKREIYGADDVHFLGTGRYCKLYAYKDLSRITAEQLEEVDALVDFSHRNVFDEVLKLAVRTHVPIIIGTSDLSNEQLKALHDATSEIPVFRGGNFRFRVKCFADRAVEFAREHNNLVLIEQHWIGQPLPSEATKMIRERISREAGKELRISNGTWYPADSLINEWILQRENEPAPSITCRTVGFDELAHDVLEIAKVMAKQPVKKGEFYTLDDIWDQIPTTAKEATTK